VYPVGHVVAACAVAWGGSRALAQSRPNLAARMAAAVDYRWIALGALLPDLIDKPLIWSGLGGSATGGHHVGHALLTPGVLLLAGAAAARYRRYELLLLGFGALTHTLFDAATHVPRSILWPFVTLPVSKTWLLGPTNIAGELLGSIALLYVIARLHKDASSSAWCGGARCEGPRVVLH
jgi:hypothetical protein